MSKYELDQERPAHFDQWIVREFRDRGGFTAMVILVAIQDLKITPLRSTWFHVVGDELDWNEVAALFGGSGVAWNGVLFATRRDEAGGGPLADAEARQEVGDLGQRVIRNRLVLNENHFFDRQGRRLLVEEVTRQ